jgi:hypothetical protein
MKTTEIAAYIATRNPRLWIGCNRPFLPLLPVVESRTQQEIGWAAFNLIACAETSPKDEVLLFFNPNLGAFGFFNFTAASDAGMVHEGWELVEFDGYGELESWKEVAS